GELCARELGEAVGHEHDRDEPAADGVERNHRASPSCRLGRSWNARLRRRDSELSVAGFDTSAEVVVLHDVAVVQREESAPAGPPRITTGLAIRSRGVRPHAEQWEDNVRAGDRPRQAERVLPRRGGWRLQDSADGRGPRTPVPPHVIPYRFSLS